jgi:hypothetical protein
MSGADRRKYLTATTLNQAFLDWSQENLDCRLEVVCEIDLGETKVRVSDRNKYVVDDGTGYFYQARTNIPVISRTLGDWLVPEIQFSTLQIELSNVDGKYNEYLAGGVNYSPWINKPVTVKMGLGELGSTYFPIFQGRITDVGGMKRSVKSITVIARDIFDQLTAEFPGEVISKSAFPYLEDQYEGKYAPVIYGDWTTSLAPDPAVIPVTPINGANPYVNGTIEDEPRQPVELLISTAALPYFDSANVFLKSGDFFYLVPTSEITVIGTGNNRFTVKQDGELWKDSQPYTYSSGDQFYVRVKGKELGTAGAHSSNIIAQARDILETYGGLESTDFDANWDTYRDKATPTQSAISTFKSRIYEDEPKSAIQYALSLLEQVRLEAFISRDQKLKINSLHFEDWAHQSYTLKNWDIEKDSFKPYLDEKNNFNRARGTYDYHPVRRENSQQTRVYKNTAAITQIGGKAISKQITFPNLYEPAVVANQVKEILRIASSSLEIADLTATWRSCLRDIGDIIKLDISIGSVEYTNVAAMVREIGYDPIGLKLPMKLWVFQMVPFNATSTVYSGTVGGYNATIDEET